jgi:DNA helicase-2/ATP-dependent DNA helicase PcrA
MELVGIAKSFDSLKPPLGLAEFLQSVALLQEQDEYEPGTDKVSLMTLHAAKGLEFPIVFIIGLEDGILPHEKSLYDILDLEEERRLAYVGITRAKEEVYLTFAHHRIRLGGFERNPPSRFIGDIPEDLLVFFDQNLTNDDENAANYQFA